MDPEVKERILILKWTTTKNVRSAFLDQKEPLQSIIETRLKFFRALYGRKLK